MGVFDNSFDNTFNGSDENDYPVGPVQGGCRREGVYLTWLTLQGGWQYWLFEGPRQRGQQSKSRGQAEQGGLDRSTQKTTAPTMTLRTANLTESEADTVGTLRESISVHILQHNEDDTITEIEVTVPTGDSQLWDTQTFTGNFSVNIVLPYRRSQLL